MPDRFWSKVDCSDADGCWTWLAGRYSNGYGQFYVDGRKICAHRMAYQLLVGDVPEGLQLDHLCRDRLCVNPAHLEPVTNQENTQRGARGRLRTHCIRGHRFDRVQAGGGRPGRRRCRTCDNERRRLARV